MRTTVTIDDDILAAARALADAQGRALGEVLSDLARKGLAPTGPAPQYRNGIRLLPLRPGAKPVTLELVNELRDEYPWSP